MKITEITKENYLKELSFKPALIKQFQIMKCEKCFLVEKDCGGFQLQKKNPNNKPQIQEFKDSCEICYEDVDYSDIAWDNNNKCLACINCNTDDNAEFPYDNWK